MYNPFETDFKNFQKNIDQNQADLKSLKKKWADIMEYGFDSCIGRKEYHSFKRDAMFTVVHAEKNLDCARYVFDRINNFAYRNIIVDINQAEAEALNIKAGYTKEGWVYATFPILLPKTGKHLNREYFTPLFYALKKINEKDFRFNEKTVLCVTQFYADDKPPSRVKDNDNLELKAVVDCAARTFLVDDGPDYCDLFISSSKAPESFTELFIVPKSDFTKWVESRRICPSEAPQLYENRP